MRENRTCGSEGGAAHQGVVPTPILLRKEGNIINWESPPTTDSIAYWRYRGL